MRHLPPLALAGALALACTSASANEVTDVYLASLGQRPALIGTSGQSADLVTIARKYVGRSARDLGLRRDLWCGAFVDMVRREAGLKPSGSDRALAQLRHGRRLSAPAVGSIAVYPRPGGTHAGLVSEITGHGTIRLVSGNSGGHRGHRFVTETERPIASAIGFVDPAK